MRADVSLISSHYFDVLRAAGKSARLSSFNTRKRSSSPSPKHLSPEKRKSLKTRDSLRSPLKDLRIMALTQNAQSKKPRTSMSNVLQNGTPRRNTFTERQADACKAPKTPRPSIGGVLGGGMPMRMAFGDQENEAPLPEKESLSEALKSFDFNNFSAQCSVQQQVDDLTNKEYRNAPMSPPKRRSLRLSGQREGLISVVSPSESTIEANGQDEAGNAGPNDNVDDSIGQGVDSQLAELFLGSIEAPHQNQTNDERQLLSGEGSSNASELLIVVTPTRDESSASTNALVFQGDTTSNLAEPGAAVSCSDEVDTEAAKQDALLAPTLDVASDDLDTLMSDKGPVTIMTEQENVLSVLQNELGTESAESIDEEEAESASEDELADHNKGELIFAKYGTNTAPEISASPRKRKAPRLSDDTSILKDFLMRTQAKRTAQAQAAQLLSAKLGPSIQLSPRRSPRRAAPTPTQERTYSSKRKASEITPDTPTKTAAAHNEDGDEDELCSPVKDSRRSTRTRPTATRTGIAAPSLIPLRRPGGQEPVKLKNTETQEMAMATRTNTRRNKGQSKMPRFVLEELSTKEPSPIKARGRPPKNKVVEWQKDEKLVSYLGEKTAKAVGGKQEKQKRSKGLGTANGTPAKPRLARPASESAGSLTPSRRLRSAQS